MIPDRENKIQRIINSIKNRRWRSSEKSTGLYFYKRVLNQRKGSENITIFLNEPYNIELLYATLACWGMDDGTVGSGPRMRWFEEFKNNIYDCEKYFIPLDSFKRHDWGSDKHLNYLRQAYMNLNLMQTNGLIVSNSKLLHFLFPDVLMPVDRRHILSWIYDGRMQIDAVDEYIEVVKFSFDVMGQQINWEDYLNDNGNTTIPKLIDNVIWKLAEE